MSLAVRKDKTYTFTEYLTWDENERWEIIKGTAYDMTPAPKVRHQTIAGNLYIKLKTRLDPDCYTGIAPTDVVFDETNVVQPDVFVVCDKSKITEKNIKGPPDLIVEVISEATEVKDRREKKNLYENFGIKEYILVYPERDYAERYYLDEGKSGVPEIYNWDEILNIYVFELDINLWEIFEKEKPGNDRKNSEGNPSP